MADDVVSAASLATEFGVPIETVLEVLPASSDGGPAEPHAPIAEAIAEDARRRLAPTAAATEMVQRGRDLIVEAFMVAKTSGRQDWHRMTVAVLKNRILDLTDRRFDEREHGFDRFVDWLAMYPEVVRVDRRQHPPIVEFFDEHLLDSRKLRSATPKGEPALEPPPEPWVVREDLWRASLSPKKGMVAVWRDSHAFLAEELSPGDLTLPQFGGETMKAMRRAFASSVPASLRGPDGDALQRWLDDDLPASALPPRARAVWNRALKRIVWQTLRQWFIEQSVPVPDDLTHPPAEHARTRDAAAELRAFVHACVDAMSIRQLEQLAIPADVARRARER